jgi:hypothetical protein
VALAALALHMFLYSEPPPFPSTLLSIASGDFQAKNFSYKYPKYFIPVILPTYTAYEYGRDRLFRNVGK